MAQLTVEQFTQKLANWVQDLKETEIPMVVAVKDTVGMMADRIFEKGLDSNNSPIGSYDTSRELWVSDDRLPKNGSHKGKNGDSIKTTYYENYKELREKQGRESGFVNLRLTNRLQSEFLNRPVNTTANSVGAPGDPERIGELEMVVSVSKEGRDKIRGNEKRFGKKIFTPTQEEEENFAKVFFFEWLNRFDEL